MNDFIDQLIQSTNKYLENKEGNVKGQVFTPPSIARFMASLCVIESNQKKVKILDPGAGAGILTVYLCLELIKRHTLDEISVVLYENDPQLQEILSVNILSLKKELKRKGVHFTAKILCKDFILSNSNFWEDNLFSKTQNADFDIAIANPPYYKLRKEDPKCRFMHEVVHGQPNIYTLFMAMTARFLKNKGQMIFITPRSFCSGLYFKTFRKWFFDQMKPTRIHVFESRKKAFNNEILQETIILKAIKSSNKRRKVTVSSSIGADFGKNYSELKNIPLDTVLSGEDSEFFLKIPSTENDLKILECMSNWHSTLLSLGFKLSTGPVVDFRSTEFLIESKEYDGVNTAPLFWMQNISGFFATWPAKKGSKTPVIKITKKSLNRLVENKNYVFIKRFTSKEQRRRIYAAVFRKSDFDSEYIGIENHLNYIWKLSGESMSEEEAWGLMSILNSPFMDKYFRIISGSTQVNANEINNMPIPGFDQIIEIGKNAISNFNREPETFSMQALSYEKEFNFV